MKFSSRFYAIVGLVGTVPLVLFAIASIPVNLKSKKIKVKSKKKIR
ncbi:MAG: hypothetical protein HXY43_14650 [Fischerella sp.]|jgi:hypothetical protein|nr:hypothetical protein [Fischerella sp.]NWF60458.1 hypothetical protein [Fischerella sp.]